MTYDETLDFLYSQLPMYSRIGKAAYKEDLKNTLELCELLDHPERKFKSVHIAGTNGKGSISHMIAAILQKAGYKTGLYTSPHLKDFRERIRINGEMIPENEVTEFVSRYKDDVMKIGCSFFEWTVGLAFDHFSKLKVDIAVIETGMGGRLDSTNVITPVLSIITNISWDHADILGDTLEKIAIEKAGIIKEGIPVVIGETDEVTEKIFRRAASEKNSVIIFADQNFSIERSERKRDKAGQPSFHLTVAEKSPPGHIDQFELDLVANYQEKNLLTVLQSVTELKKAGFKISDAATSEALSNVTKATGLRGRWDILGMNPTIIADVAHNEAGLKYAMKNLNEYAYDRLHIVLGMVQEKDLQKILPLFPKDALYYFCSPNIPRGLDAEVLRQEAGKMGLKGKSYHSVREAYDAARSNSAIHDLIYVGGSTFVVAEVI